MSNCEKCRDKDWCSSEEMCLEECPVRPSCHSCDHMSIYGCTNGYKSDYKMTNKQAINIVNSTELIIPEGRMKLIHDAFTRVIQALKFVDENYPKAFIEYLEGGRR